MMCKRFFVLYKNISSRSVYNLTKSLNENSKQNNYEYNKYNGYFRKVIAGFTIVSFGYYLTGGKSTV